MRLLIWISGAAGGCLFHGAVELARILIGVVMEGGWKDFFF